MKENRLCFENIKCPYCGDAPGWLFKVDDLGDKSIKCSKCGKLFMATISVIQVPHVEAIYKLVEVL